MDRDAAAYVHAERGDLAVHPGMRHGAPVGASRCAAAFELVGPSDPHAGEVLLGRARALVGGDALLGQRRDDGEFERAQVPDDVIRAHDRVADEHAGPVIRRKAATLGGHDLEVVLAQERDARLADVLGHQHAGHAATRSTTQSMHAVSACTSAGSIAGNIPTRSWLRPSLR